MSEGATIFVFAVAGIGLIIAALWLIGYLFSGAAVLFVWASEQGFIGIAAYFTAWVFLLPIMLIGSTLVGIFLHWSEASAPREIARIEKGDAPSDPHERFKWANRLPPYDT